MRFPVLPYILLLATFCHADSPTILGYLCNITWAAYVVTENSPGSLVGSYSGDTYTQIKFYPSTSSTPPTFSQLGFVQYFQIDGTDIPRDSNGNPSQIGTYYLCSQIRSTRVMSSAPPDVLSAIGNLNTSHSIGPIYNSSAGLPYVQDDFGNVSGFNDNFAPQQIVQGQSGNKYLVYTSDGQPILSDSDNGYVWVNDGNGNWQLRPNTNETGSIDLTPVVNAIEGVQQKQDLQRQALITLLSSNGNSWVLDCKLSLEELESLATSIGLRLDSYSSILSTINGNVASIESNVRLNVAPRLQNLTTILNAINTQRLTPIQNTLVDLNTTVHALNSKIPDGTETVPVLPSPVLPTDSPDSALPSYLQSFNWDVSTPLSTLQGWTSETGLIKFGIGSLDGWLARFLSVPNVGSDPYMFTVNFDIPYLGYIHRDFSFADWTIIPLFRQVALYALYIFFGFAIYKLLHKTLQ